MKTLLTALLLGTAAACALAAGRAPAMRDIHVTSRGADRDNTAEMCADFSLTPAEASRFFAKAKLVDFREIHDRYSWAPCYVRGTGRVGRQPVSWEVRAAGTASLTYADGRTQWLADESQQETQE